MAHDAAGGRGEGAGPPPLALAPPALRAAIVMIWERLEGPRFIRFCLVGLSGIVVNLGLLLLLERYLGVYAPAAFAVGTEVSILTNFVVNDRWTFRDRPGAGGWNGLGRRILWYNLGYVPGVALQLSLFAPLWGLLNLSSLAAGLVAIVASTYWNYGISRGKVWGSGR